MTLPLRITYLVEDTAQSDEANVLLGHADALIARGHRVTIVTKGTPLTWRASRAEWAYVTDFREYDSVHDDFIVATSSTTVAPAWEMDAGRALHLCQGEIQEASSPPIPKLVVSRSLIPTCRQFTNDITYMGPIVEDEVYRSSTPRESTPLRVLLCGESQIETKGVITGYGAVAHARWFHQNFDLIRTSVWAPSREEPLDSVQEFHVALKTNEMTRLMHSCDILLGPNHGEEGLGLPAAKGMAAGLPCVLTAIPSFLSFDDTQDYALFAPERNAVELGEKLIELLSNPELRVRLRSRGHAVAEQWRAETVGDLLERIFLERRGAAAQR